MRVAVCDYDLAFLEEMKSHLQALDSLTAIDIYSDKDDFLNKIKTDKKYDLVFLNVNWGISNQTELEFGEQIYSIIDNIPVVLVVDGFEEKKHFLLWDLRLTGYLLKPVDKTMVTRYVEKIRNRFFLNYLVFSSHGKKIRLHPDEIIHIESHNHKINIYTKDEIYDVYEKISDVKKRLTQEFVQCHKSFVVNLKWIASVEGKRVKVINGKEIPISRSYQIIFNKEFAKYIEQGNIPFK